MAASTSMFQFLRPLGPPRVATVQQFLRFSTATPWQAKQGLARAMRRQEEDPNLVASRSASPTYPPPSMKSLPRPIESRASRRTSHPPKRREYPTRQVSHHQPEPRKLIPEPVELLPPKECAPNLPYFVSRTPSDELPVYTLRKRGGNLKITRVKKIDGDRQCLKKLLQDVCAVSSKDASVNSVTGHIIIKGHYKSEIEKFLQERNF